MIPLLRGTRVVEVSSVVMGPFAGQILADLGADVVKIEPIEGDIARTAAPSVNGMGALFVNNNRNKQVIALDLKTPDGQEVGRRLIARADVLLHNLRVDAADRLGLGFESAVTANPRLIYCATVGFGRNGRYRDRPAFDDVIQAASGLAGLFEATLGEPRFVPSIIADKIAALHAVYGILAALVARANGEAGEIGAVRVEVPMFETMVSFLLNEHLAGATFEEHGDLGYRRVLSRNRRPYRTRDGWVAVLAYTHEQWRRFLIEAGRADILEEPWFQDAAQRQARLDYLYAVVAETLSTRNTAEWLDAFARLDIPASAINRLEDLLDDPHLADVGFFAVGEQYPREIVRALPQPVHFAAQTYSADRPAPALGADTRAVLRDCGYDEAAIDRLVSCGVARHTGP